MKKLFCLLICLTMTLSMVLTVNAANELAGAKKYTLGTSKDGSIFEGDESDVYKFTLPTSGKIDIEFWADMESVDLKLYDGAGKELWSDTAYWNSTIEEISYSNEFVLCKGDYYFSASMTWRDHEGEYNFNIAETAIYESFPDVESNNSTKTANSIIDGNEYIGCIALNDNTDVYKFNLPTAGKIDLNFFADMESADLKLYDATGKELWSDTAYWNSTTEEISYSKELFLCKGDYYFSTSMTWRNHVGSYSFKLLFTSANESFSEVQNGINKFSAANMIDPNNKYIGFIALNDDIDLYRINLNHIKTTLNLSSDMESVDLKIYDTTGKELWSDTAYWNNTTEEISYSKELNLAQGEYVLTVSKTWRNHEGTFTFWFADGTKPVAGPGPIEIIIKVLVNGNSVYFDQPPMVENNRTLVPLRAIFEALGATVTWHQNTQTITAEKAGTNISLQLGSTQMYVNGNVKTLDVPAKVINSRTLVPVRAISEAFNCKVDWIQDTQTVVITQ